MGRVTSDLFKINGVNMFPPDEDMEFSFEDIDSADAGRDEAGKMHRIVVRYKVGKWSFSYKVMSEADYQYMESLFPNEGSFQFTHPSRLNASVPETTECYRSKYSTSWRNARLGKWMNYKFNIIEM